jgi:cell division protein FtsL
VLECAAGCVAEEEAVCADEDGVEHVAVERMRLRLPDSKSLPVMRE